MRRHRRGCEQSLKAGFVPSPLASLPSMFVSVFFFSIGQKFPLQSRNCHKHSFSFVKCYAVTGSGIKAFTGWFRGERRGKKKEKIKGNKKDKRKYSKYFIYSTLRKTRKQQHQNHMRAVITLVQQQPRLARAMPVAARGKERQHQKAKQVKGANYVRAKCSCMCSPPLLLGLLSSGDLNVMGSLCSVHCWVPIST